MSSTQSSTTKAVKSTKSKKDALSGLKRSMFGMDPSVHVIIGLDTEHKEGEHPLWDKRIGEPLDESMVRSIMKVGVLQPVTIRKNNGVPEVVFGRRRIRCAREANKRLAEKGESTIVVNTISIQGDDRLMLGIMITENELRVDNTPLEKSRLLKKLLDVDYTDRECADFFGVTQTAIRNWKKLLNCCDAVVEAVEAGELSSSAAADLAVFPIEEQETKLIELRKEAMKAVENAPDSGNTQGKKPKISNKATTNARHKATNSGHATAHKPPRKPVLTSVVEFAMKAPEKSKLSADAVDVLKWALGQVPASEIPGLEEALEAISLVKQGEKLKLTDAQQTIVDKLLVAPELYTDLNRKVTDAMVKKEIIETFEAEDGTTQVRLTESYKAILAAGPVGEAGADEGAAA